MLTLEEHALKGGFGSAVLEFFEQENKPMPYVKEWVFLTALLSTVA